jgi:hypothetical protein
MARNALKMLFNLDLFFWLRKPRGACDKLATRNYQTYLTQEKQNGIQNP